MSFVVDASVAVAWFVKAQATTYTEALLDRTARERIHVPALWHAEFGNALLALVHRRKLDPVRLDGIFDAIDDLELVTDVEPPAARGLAALSRRLALSAYDAT
jgi:predicted nucleic acid-binding protein